MGRSSIRESARKVINPNTQQSVRPALLQQGVRHSAYGVFCVRLSYAQFKELDYLADKVLEVVHMIFPQVVLLDVNQDGVGTPAQEKTAVVRNDGFCHRGCLPR